jgi:hypothetical protein
MKFQVRRPAFFESTVDLRGFREVLEIRLPFLIEALCLFGVYYGLRCQSISNTIVGNAF